MLLYFVCYVDREILTLPVEKHWFMAYVDCHKSWACILVLFVGSCHLQCSHHAFTQIPALRSDPHHYPSVDEPLPPSKLSWVTPFPRFCHYLLPSFAWECVYLSVRSVCDMRFTLSHQAIFLNAHSHHLHQCSVINDIDITVMRLYEFIGET